MTKRHAKLPLSFTHPEFESLRKDAKVVFPYQPAQLAQTS